MSHLTRPFRLAAVVSLALTVVSLEPLLAQNYVAQLCEQTDCQTRIFALPRIDSILFNHVTPGGAIFLKGRGLANTTALTLKLVDFTGQPKEAVISSIESGYGFIGAQVLVGVVGVKDQQGILQARNASNQFSNEFPVNFVAERESRLLPPSDAAARLISCSYDSNYDTCKGQTDPDDNSPRYVGTGPALVPIWGSHTNCWGCVGNDSGTDEFEVVLANGWFVDAIDFTQGIKPNKNEAWATAPVVPNGTSNWRPRISWYATPNDTAHYSINVQIVGPRGVPWR